VESSDEEIFVFSCVLFNRHDEIFAYSILVTCVWLHPMQVVAFLVKRPHIVKWVHSYIYIYMDMMSRHLPGDGRW
jgi:hypothetical protein